MKLKQIYRFLSVTLLFYYGSQQNASAQLENIRPEVINEAQGLSSRLVNCFLQDHQGYMWIGSAEGLNRYDGYSFKIFRKVQNDSSSLISNGISSLAEDKDHMIWIGYTKGGISCLNPVTQKCINYYPNEKVAGSIPPGGVDYIFMDKENRMWLGIFQHGLTHFDRKVNSFYNYGTLPDIDPGYTPESQKSYNSICGIYQSNKGLFWLITRNGLYSFDSQKKLFSPKRNKPVVAYQWRDDSFGPFVPVGDSALWIGSWGGGISYYNMKTGEWKSFKSEGGNFPGSTKNIVSAMSRKSEDELWISTREKIAIFNIKEGRLYLGNEADDKIGADLIWKMYTDKNNNLWFSFNNGAGLIRANARLFSFTKQYVSKSTNGNYYSIISVYKDTINHLLFLGTGYADGLHVINEKTKTEHCLTFEIKSNEDRTCLATDFKKDYKGRLWVSTRDCMYQYDYATQALIKIPQPPVDTSFHRTPFYNQLIEDSHHNIWIATLRYGVYKLDPETFTYTHYDKDSATLSVRGINSMVEDNQGRIWFGNGEKGIDVYNESTGQFTHYKHDDKDSLSLINNVVSGLTKDASGNIWASTYGGLSKVENESNRKIHFKNYSIKDGLPSETIISIIGDNEGNIWFASLVGFSMLNPETRQVKTYTSKDGLSQDYAAYSLYKTDDGELFIETYKGYHRFYPSSISKTEPLIPVVINSFEVFDKERPLEVDKTINLSYKENFFSFDFAAINFFDPENVQYAYKLEGFDNDWIYCGNRRYASYTNLNGGNYIFKAKAANRDGLWGNEIAIPIHIEPPFWKKSWFLLLSVVLISLLIYAIYMYRIKQIRRTEKLKTQFNKKIADVEMRALRAQMNPHFVFNCLNSINRYIVKSDTKTASLYLTKFARLIRLILDNSENHNVLLSHELEALKLYIEMESIRFENKFSYEIKAGEDLNADSISVPPLIVQPYVENAIWHGLLSKETRGNLLLEVTRMNGTLQFVVEDNGIGRAKAMELKSKSATTRKSLGMKLTEDRIAILNEYTGETSSVEIIDLKDKEGIDCGTKVIIRIPVEDKI